MNDFDISYSLSKQLPDMERRFTIQTSYGDLNVQAHEAADFIAAARLMLFQRKQAHTQQEAA